MKSTLPLALVASLTLSAATAAADLEGTWMSGDTHVRMSPCGGAMCGKIVWLRHPLDGSGKPRNDTLNPDASKRQRPMLGLQVASLKLDKTGSWSGTVYNADEGKSFNVSVKVDNEKQATLKGCVLGVVCKNVAWTRVD